MTSVDPFAGHVPAAALRAAAGKTSMRSAWRAGRALLIGAGLLTAVAAQAQSTDPAAAQPAAGEAGAPTVAESSGTIGGRASQAAAGLCVEVDVAGYRAGHLDCATLRLQEATREAQARAPNAAAFDAPDATSADVVTGVANQTATRQRMGNTFGTSVHPQRPPAPVFSPPIGRRP